MRQHGRIAVDAVSMLLEFPALAPTKQPDFLNCVAQIQTDLPPEELLAVLNDIEQQLGRTRTERHAPRTIDLDIIMYNSLVIQTDTLKIPHPQMHLRSFVMCGIAELAPDLIHPVIGETMTVLKQRLNMQDFVISKNKPKLISIAGIIGVGKTTLAHAIAEIINCQVLNEAYDTNPYISDVYAGRTDLAIKSQLYFLNSRAEQLAPDKLPANQPIISDYIFEKDKIFAKRTLTRQEFSEYCIRYDEVNSIIQKPILAIYLSDTPSRALNRIHFRNRSYEQQIKQATLADFAKDYDELFGDYKNCPVIILDGATFDCKKQDDINSLVKQIRAYI